MRKIFSHILPAILLLAVFYYLGLEFFQNWDHIKNFSFKFRLGLLAAASAIYALTMACLALGWYCILRFLHHHFPLRNTLSCFFITQPAKYVPGKIWIAVARMKFCGSHGIPHSITFLTTGIEGLLEIFGGMYVALFALSQTGILKEFSIAAQFAIAATGLLILIPRVFYFFVNLYFKIVKRDPIPRENFMSFGKLLLLQIIYLLGMLGFGISQLLFLQSFAPVSPEHFPALIGIGTFSYVIGIIALFAPGGLGVREGIWFVALKGIVEPHVAILYAFVSRLWTIIVELILTLISICAKGIIMVLYKKI